MSEDLVQVLSPIKEHCTKSGGGGLPVLTNFATPDPALANFGSGYLKWPQDVVCHQDNKIVWVLDLAYAGFQKTDPNRSFDLNYRTTVSSSVLTADQYAVREEAASNERARIAAEKRHREIEQDRAQQEVLKSKAAEQSRVDAERRAQAVEFRKKVKAGDRFRWIDPARPRSGQYVGIIVRVEGPLVFVQFDNLKISGQQTRYVSIDDIEPFTGPTPQMQYNIN